MERSLLVKRLIRIAQQLIDMERVADDYRDPDSHVKGPLKTLSVKMRRRPGTRDEFQVDFMVQVGPGQYETVKTENLKRPEGEGHAAWRERVVRPVATELATQHGCNRVDLDA